MNLQSAPYRSAEIARERSPLTLNDKVEIVIPNRTSHEEIAHDSSYYKDSLAALRRYIERFLYSYPQRNQPVRSTRISASIVHDILSSTQRDRTPAITLSRHRP
jgi:hypothetical protein